MLYWECQRRLESLRRFREAVSVYFANIEYANWMAGGAAPTMNDTAKKARVQLNLLMEDVTSSLDLQSIPHSVHYHWSPMMRMSPQVVDLMENIFILYQYKDLPHDRLFDCLERGIGYYEGESRRLRRASFNPLYWLRLAIVWVLHLPFALLGAAGFDVAENSKAGKVVKLATFTGSAVAFVAGIVQILLGWPTVRDLLHRH
jgi:hypothetical protein